MVRKSKRWQGLLNKVEGEGKGPSFLGDKEVCAPQPLKITYGRPDGEAVVEELVYEDSTGDAPKKKEDDELPARLLVPLTNVLRLKELCEHEHARYDEVVDTLSICRSDYLKELCWLREQLHLLRNDPPKKDLPDENFEVRWFTPPKYIDPDLKKFLMDCIHDNIAHLTTEIEALRAQVANLQEREQALLGDPSARALLRRMLQDNKPGFLLSELSAILCKEEDIEDLERVAKDIFHFLVPEAPQIQVQPEVVVKKEVVQDPALLEEVEALKRKALMDAQLIAQLRESLNEGLERRMSADVEKERAEAERSRADAQEDRANEERRLKEEAQALADKEKRRAEELEAKMQKLQMELANTTKAEVAPEVARQVRQSVLRMSTAIDSLNQGTRQQSKRRSVLGTSGDLARSFGRSGTFDEDRGGRGGGTANSSSSGASSTTTIYGLPVEGVDELAQRKRTLSLKSSPDIDEDAMNLNTLASILEETVPKTLGEFDAMHNEHEANMARGHEDAARQSQHERDIEEAAKAAADKAASDMQADFEARLQELERRKNAEIAELEKKLQEMRARLEQEQGKNADLQASIDDLETKNVQLGQRMQKYKQKAEEAKRKLKALKQSTDNDSSESEDVEEDDDDDDDMRFLISYTRRTKRLSALGKRRWEMLSEDANCAKQRREFIMGIHPLRKSCPEVQLGRDDHELHHIMGSLSQEDMPDALQLLVRQQHEDIHHASTMPASQHRDSRDEPLQASTLLATRQRRGTPFASTMPVNRQSDEAPLAQTTVLVNRQRDEPPHAQETLSQQHEQVKAAFNFLTASRSAASHFPTAPGSHAALAHGSDLTEMLALGARQRRHRPELTDIGGLAHTSLTPLPLANDMWPKNSMAFANTFPSQPRARNQTEPVEIKLLGKAAEKRNMLPTSPGLQRTTVGASQIDVEPHPLLHHGGAKGSKVSKHEAEPKREQLQSQLQLSYEGPLSPKLVEKIWSLDMPQVEELPQGASNGVAMQPANAAHEATDPFHRSTFSNKRQGQAQSRKVFQTTWHGSSQKTTASSWNPSQQPGALKSPRAIHGDSLPDLLSVDRQSASPLRSRAPPSTKASEERQAMRGRAEHKMGKTMHGSGWPSAEKRSAKWPTRAPLTNAARANQHYASAPDLLRFRATGDAFLPEVLPPLPAGRQLKMERHYLPGLSS
mmetsp:Transcript_152089/g.291193  ORF Transcript_152089/g.291193 Transcript_152089/m.291193 type:complete len:1182 (+) Transcript_152089:91-3636(+)